MISWTQQEGDAVPRPRTGETPIRHVRIAGKTWGEVERIAREEGRSVTSVVRDALVRYLAWHKRQSRRSGD